MKAIFAGSYEKIGFDALLVVNRYRSWTLKSNMYPLIEIYIHRSIAQVASWVTLIRNGTHVGEYSIFPAPQDRPCDRQHSGGSINQRAISEDCNL